MSLGVLKTSEYMEETSEGYIRDIVKRSGSSFGLGMRILPPLQRYAMFAIYAFGREVDDIADSEESQSDKLFQLEDWRGEVEALFAGYPKKPTAWALWRTIQKFPLPRQEFLALIDGMEMDVRGQMYAPSRECLRLYCRRVAGAVGMLSLPVLGVKGEFAEEFAISLGEGFQLTNILRDIDEDATRGRLYLPREVLETYSVEVQGLALSQILRSSGIDEVCREIACEARRCYTRVEQVLRHLEKGCIRSVLLMFGVYEGLLRRLERRGWNFPRIPVRMSTFSKGWMAMRRAFLSDVWSP